MVLNYTEGCTCGSLTVDGVETVDMPLRKFKSVLKKCIDAEDDVAVLQGIFKTILENKGDYEDLGQCEECGDWVSSYTYTL